jgi:GNAT superfamily N-acetyltransferase
MVFLIRTAAQADREILIELYAELNRSDPLPDKEDFDLKLREILCNPLLHLVVAEVQGKVCGTCYLNIVPNLTRGLKPYAVLENVIVLASHRRKGIGRALMNYSLDYAWSHGCYKVMLLTGSKSEATHRLYVGAGFSGTEKMGYVARPSVGGRGEISSDTESYAKDLISHFQSGDLP